MLERLEIYQKLDRYVTNLGKIKSKALPTVEDLESASSYERDIISYITDAAEYRTAARLYLKGMLTPANFNWLLDILVRN